MRNREDMFLCPRCKSERTIWIGYRYNNSGKKRVRRCKDCWTKFTPNHLFPRARFDMANVIEAVGLYNCGMSLADVKNHMQQHRDVNVSRTSILNWTRKYSRLVKDFTSKLQNVIRGVGHCNDVYLDVKGYEIHYWGAIDSKVIFKIKSNISITVQDDVQDNK